MLWSKTNPSCAQRCTTLVLISLKKREKFQRVWCDQSIGAPLPILDRTGPRSAFNLRYIIIPLGLSGTAGFTLWISFTSSACLIAAGLCVPVTFYPIKAKKTCRRETVPVCIKPSPADTVYPQHWRFTCANGLGLKSNLTPRTRASITKNNMIIPPLFFSFPPLSRLNWSTKPASIWWNLFYFKEKEGETKRRWWNGTADDRRCKSVKVDFFF